MLDHAKANGISSLGNVKTRALLTEFRDVFRVRLGNDAPADIPPLDLKLKPGAAPTKNTQRVRSGATRFLALNYQEVGGSWGCSC